MHLVTLIAAVLAAPTAASALAVYHWQSDAGGAWNNPANWRVVQGNASADGYPNSPGDIAVFDTLQGVKTITIPDTVTVTVGRLSFLFDSDDDRVEIVSEGSGRLVFFNMGTPAGIEVSPLGQASVSGLVLNEDLFTVGGVRLNAISETGGPRDLTIHNYASSTFTFGPAPNTYTGTTTLRNGRMTFAPADVVRIPGPFVCGVTGVTPDWAIADISGHAIAPTSDVTVSANAQMRIGGTLTGDLRFDDLIIDGDLEFVTDARLVVSTLTIRGGHLVPSVQANNEIVLPITLKATSTTRGAARIQPRTFVGAGTLTPRTPFTNLVIDDGPEAIDAVIGANIAGAGMSMRKLGAGVAQFFAASYTGATLIAEGTLVVSATMPQSAVSVASGATFAGSGQTGAVTVASGGAISPGSAVLLGSLGSVSWLRTGSVTFADGARFVVQIEGTPGTTGPGYDWLDVTGTIDLGNATLDLSSVFELRPDAAYTIVNNDGAEPVTGAFTGLAEGATIETASGARFTLSYHGGDGNDVVLTNSTPVISYFLSEGATGAFFDEDVAIANPHAVPAPITLTFFLPGGGTIVQQRTVPALSRITIAVDEIPGLGETSPSVEVRSDNRLALAVERTMTWDASHYGGHTANAVPRAERQWYFAEGAQGFFDTYLLLANPNAAAVDATVTFLRENDSPVVETVRLPALSRVTVHAGDYPALRDRSFGMTVETPVPITAERAMYFATSPTRLWTGGHANVGNPAPSTAWFHAEGASGSYFSTFILMSNPQNTTAHVTLRFLRADGFQTEVIRTIQPRQRLTVNPASDRIPGMAESSFATEITSDVPIVSERAMYWPGDDTTLGEGHASSGVTRTWPTWGLGEGRVGGPNDYATYILLANPHPSVANVTVTFLRESGAPVVKSYPVMPGTRFNIDVGAMVPELANEAFGVRVESLDTPIAVERSIYWNVDGRFWAGGTNAIGTPLPY